MPRSAGPPIGWRPPNRSLPIAASGCTACAGRGTLRYGHMRRAGFSRSRQRPNADRSRRCTTSCGALFPLKCSLPKPFFKRAQNVPFGPVPALAGLLCANGGHSRHEYRSPEADILHGPSDDQDGWEADSRVLGKNWLKRGRQEFIHQINNKRVRNVRDTLSE